MLIFNVLFFILVLNSILVCVIAQEDSQFIEQSIAPISSSPHIIFLYADDAGIADFQYSSVVKDIPTPNIDFLANLGVKLENYYTQALCTPSRAALMTGRYSINTGLTSVLVPGTPAGIPDFQTLPQTLHENGYSTAMVGKWHLGHAKQKQTPVGKGFEKHIGLYMWDIDSYTKQMYEDPFSPAMMIDWIESYSNGSYRHYAEPRHAMVAINDISVDIIKSHTETNPNKPLFLYVAYTAAHSPLQPLPEHARRCKHIPHQWRRLFCGMIQGIDESVRDITMAAYEYLGPNTIIVVSSDNGGSPWFGGMNTPSRGGKASPFEGGVKVPTFIIELSVLSKINNDIPLTVPTMGHFDKHNPLTHFRHISDSLYSPDNYPRGRTYSSFFHVCDWLPTLIGYTNLPSSVMSNLISISEGRFDGIDLSSSLNLYNKPINDQSIVTRQEILLEMFISEDCMWKYDVFAYRLGDMKLILTNNIRDNNWYYPSNKDSMNLTSLTFPVIRTFYDSLMGKSTWENWITMAKYHISTYAMQAFIRFFGIIFDESAYDIFKITLVHNYLQGYFGTLPPVDHILYPEYKHTNPSIPLYFSPNKAPYFTSENVSDSRLQQVWLYNITADPEEKYNLANENPDIISIIQKRIVHYFENRPEQQKVWLQYHLIREWNKTHVHGDCSMNSDISESECKFTHPWIDDDADLWADTNAIVDGVEYAKSRVRDRLTVYGGRLLLALTATLLVIRGATYLVGNQAM